jgi:putative FmdB family regulatory protein
MPIYEYECTKCGHQRELLQRITETATPKCEVCKSRMRRLISQSAFHLKGTGWYVTDYASNRASGGKKSSTGEKDSSIKETKDSGDNSKKDGASSSIKKD